VDVLNTSVAPVKDSWFSSGIRLALEGHSGGFSLRPEMNKEEITCGITSGGSQWNGIRN
jgi:hypothetical protein